MKKLLRIVLLAMLSLQILGGSHALLQTYAWTTMLVTYSQTDGVGEAIVNTFSGKKPCAICLRIVSERHSDGLPGISKVALDWQNLLPPTPFSLLRGFPSLAPAIPALEPAILRAQCNHAPQSPPPQVLG